MKKKFNLYLFLCVITVLSASLVNADTMLRIGLRSLDNAKVLNISSSSKISVLEALSRSILLTAQPSEKISIQINDGSFSINTLGRQITAKSTLLITSEDSSSIISINFGQKKNKSYRGFLEIKNNNQHINIVNVIDTESYLMGVVNAEMPASYPEEALKAQAIAARTYALRNSTKHKSSGYDLCDTGHCQVYGGVNHEKARTTKAVLDTCGQVLTYDNLIASVMYSADCGGATQNYDQLYPYSRHPYLCGVVEPVEIPHQHWKITLTKKELSNKLTQAGIKEAVNLTDIKVDKTSSDGRAMSVVLILQDGNKTISAEKLRAAVGYSVMKSTFFTITSDSSNCLTFIGKGVGHGVGMCQVGAKWLASSPNNLDFSQILKHYFPGVDIKDVSAVKPVYAAIGKKSSRQKETQIKTVSAKKTNPLVIDLRLNSPGGL